MTASLRRLLSDGADVDARDKINMTCLMITARRGREKMTELLLNNKAGVRLCLYSEYFENNLVISM